MSWSDLATFGADMLAVGRIVLAAGWDWLSDVSPAFVGVLTLGWLLPRIANLFWLQRRLNHDVPADRKDADGPLSLWRLELRYSSTVQTLAAVIAVVLLPIVLIAGGVWLVRKLVNKAKEKAAAVAKKSDEAADDGPAAAGRDDAEDSRPNVGILVATIGPSLVDGALAAWGIYWGVLVLDWLLARVHGLGAGASGVDYIFLGLYPELAWVWPLERFPAAHLMLAAAVWLTVWWQLARFSRLFAGAELTSNLYRGEHVFEGLNRWRRWYATWSLWQAEASYTNWLRWLLAGALPFLLLATASSEPHPYGLAPAALALTWASYIALGLQTLLRGRFEPIAPPPPPPPPVAADSAGWREVRQDLEVRLRATFPDGIGLRRPVMRISVDSSLSSALEPLLRGDLLGRLSQRPGDAATDRRGLLRLQADILDDLGANRPVDHRVEQESEGGLRLQGARSTSQSGAELRWNCIVAAEGAGKTTAAMLAAAEMAVIDVRSTLVICRHRPAAQAWRERFDRLVTPTTLRWTIRSAQVGEDSQRRLVRGDVPDIVTCSLEELVVGILDKPLVFAALLERIGLIVIDDLESFCGPVEQHLQLALRRLVRRLRQVGACVDSGTGRTSIAVLALLQPSAPEIVTWAKAMCGDERMVVRVYGPGNEQATAAQSQFLVPVSQIRKPNGLAVGFQDVVDSCERLGVPWTWRKAGDANRHLGRTSLPLRMEPKWYRDDPAESAVVLVSGPWATVQREWDLLVSAGRAFSCFSEVGAGGRATPIWPADAERTARNDIAILSLVDGDEHMAFGDLDGGAELAREAQRLPRPLVRQPRGDVAEAHLVAELLREEGIEVADALALCGPDAGPVLARLVESELAIATPRVDVREDVAGHVHVVDVRVQHDALPSPERIRSFIDEARLELQRRERDLAKALREGDPRAVAEVASQLAAARWKLRNPLPIQHPPTDVEVGAFGGTRLWDRTTAKAIATVDADAVATLYYPGRVFELDAGRFVVREVAASRNAAHSEAPGEIPVEPWADASESSPRRRISIEWSDTTHVPDVPSAMAKVTESSQIDDATRPPAQVRPVLFGRVPLAIHVGPATLRVLHRATVHFEPLHGHVVRISLLTAIERAAFESMGPIDTRALWLAPWSFAVSGAVPEGDAYLTLESARLIAAAMRLALPSLFRGADLTCGIGIVPIWMRQDSTETEGADEAGVTPTPPMNPTADATSTGFEPDDVESASPSPARGHAIVLYDLQRGGTSVVDAIERDGLEMLLRLARRVLERVLYHDRLLVRFDEWGDDDELLRAAAVEAELRAQEARASEDQGSSRPVGRRARDADRRGRALQWLDAVLRPEGTSSLANSARWYKSGVEEGEGDPFDLGRAWYTRDGSVANLVWSKHRWMLSPAMEAAMDCGVDGQTAHAAAAWLLPPRSDDAERSGILAAIQQLVSVGNSRHVPEQVHWARTHDEIDSSVIERSAEIALPWAAASAWSWTRLQPFVDLLRRTWDDDEDTRSRVRLPDSPMPEVAAFARIRAVAALVQAMANDPDRIGIDRLPAPPLHTLLTRSGGALDKSLLFAILAWRCGMQAGLFVRKAPNEHGVQVLGAVGIGEVATAGKDRADFLPEAMRTVESWRTTVALDVPCPMFAIGRSFTLLGTMQSEDLIFVPVDLTAELDPGVAQVGDPAQWEFLPLTSVPVFHAPPGHVRLKVTLDPPIEDTDAPPLPDEDDLERRCYTPDPWLVQADHIVRTYRFCDVNDGAWHEFELRLPVSAVVEAVGRHGLPRDVLSFRYRDQAEREAKRQQLRQYAAARGLQYDEDNCLCADHHAMVRSGAASLAGVVEALRRAAGDKATGRAWSGFLASFVQSIPYRIPTDDLIGGGHFYSLGIMPALETLARNFGDCDTKSVLFSALSVAGKAPKTSLVLVPMHMFVGVQIEPEGDETSARTAKGRFVLVELTSSFRLGSVAEEYTGIDGSGRHGESFIHIDDLGAA